MAPVFIIVGALVFFLLSGGLVLLVFRLLGSRKNKDLQTNPNHFTLRAASRGESGLLIFASVFWFLVLTVGISFLSEPGGMFFLWILCLPVVLFRIAQGIYWSVWKVEVKGSEIHYQSLFSRKIVLFQEIKRVKPKLRPRAYGLNVVARADVYSDTGKLFSVRPDSLGYKLFHQRLKDRDILSPLPKNEGQHSINGGQDSVSGTLRKSFDKSAVLFMVQLVLWAIAAVANAVLMFSDTWVLSGRYTVLELLEGYLLWFWISLLGFAAISLFIVLANVLIIASLKRTKDFSKQNVIGALIGILTVVPLSIGISVYANFPALIYDTRADIAAIEEGNLLEGEYFLHLTWENYYRTAAPRDVGAYEPFYVVRQGELGRLYFPRELSPANLKAQAADPIYQVPGHHTSRRHFAIRYTPNFQIVLEAVPIAGG